MAHPDLLAVTRGGKERERGEKKWKGNGGHGRGRGTGKGEGWEGARWTGRERKGWEVFRGTCCEVLGGNKRPCISSLIPQA